MSSEEENESNKGNLRQVAKKSTAAPAPVPNTRAYAMRRQGSSTSYRTMTDRFLENFNPETSIREKRKLNRKINPPSTVRRPPGAIYDENGIHVSSYTDLCDCLNEECVGCFFDCPKCGSNKCGPECRVHRKYFYEELEYHGYDLHVKNPLLKH